MKKLSRITLFLALPLLLFCLSGKADAAALNTRALWVASVYNLDYPSRSGLSAKALQAEADAILAYASEIHASDLYLQVRGCGDALYASEIFPWSGYLSGKTGVAPDGNFDPLAYFIEAGHKKGIRIHAWINPYLLTRQKAETRDAAFALLAEGHPAREIADAVVLHSDGRLYLDPGHPDSRNLVLRGIREILENYAVDGIHFDDYFYPDASFADKTTVDAFGNGTDTDAFRRQSVNTLIAETYALVHQQPGRVFGVSPAGIWANNTTDPAGSATKGKESLNTAFADSRKWVKAGIVDYLIPQIYWHIGHESADFEVLANWWNAVAAGTNVKLYLGLGPYRMEEDGHDPAWDSTDELMHQLALCQQLEHISGVSLYRYSSCKNSNELTDLLAKTFEVFEKSEENEQFFVGKDAPIQNPPSLLTPTTSLIGEPGGELELFVTAPANGKVTVFYGQESCALPKKSDGYSGTLSLPEEHTTAPLLLVYEKAGLVLVTLSPVTVTVPENTPSVKGFQYADSDSSHISTLLLDGTCQAEATLQDGQVTLTLSPCGFAPLLEDPFFQEQTVVQQDGHWVYKFSVPQDVHTVRIEWSDTRLRLIFDRS